MVYETRASPQGRTQRMTEEGTRAWSSTILPRPMQITIDDVSPVEKRVHFELPWTEVASRLDKKYGQLRRDARIKGFRPGKAPRTVLEQLYRGSVEEEVARDLVEHSLGQAISEKQLEPVSPARVGHVELTAGKPFKFVANVDVQSNVEPKDYSGLALERRPPKVSDEQVDGTIERYQQQFTKYVPVEGRSVAADTDIVSILINGRVGEHKIKKAEVMVDLTTLVGGPLPGLAAALRGRELGESKVHDVKYQIPADEPQKDLAGKDVNLHIVIKESRQKVVPPIDDELAKDTGEAETLVELKQKIRDRLTEEDKVQIKNELGVAASHELVARNPFPLARSIIERFAENRVRRSKAQLQMMGVDPAMVDDQQLFEREKVEAEREARTSILLRAIAEKEGLEVSDADLQKRLAELAAARQESVKKLRADFAQSGRMEGLKAALLEEKALDKVLSVAKITDADPARLIVSPEEAKAETGKRKKK